VAHLDFLDALRGLAFLGVLVCHVAYLTGDFDGKAVFFAGRYGVQLFFLVSAITLAMSLVQRTKVERHPVQNFLLRRFFRIAPLFWTAAFFYLALWGTGSRPFAPGGIELWQFVLTLFFAHGWTPISINNVVPGGWTIAAEFTFYFLLPFTFRFFRDVRSSLAITTGAVLVALALKKGAVLWLPFIVPASQARLIPEFLYFWFPAQLPVFCLGLAIFRLSELPGVMAFLRTGSRAGILLVAAFVAMLLWTYLPPPYLPRHVSFALAFSALTLSLTARPTRLLVTPWMTWLGRLSFSCYLTHFSVIEFVAFWLPGSAFLVFGAQANLVHFAGFTLVSLLVTVAVSLVTYSFIEQPGIRAGRRLIRWRETAAA
jgi:peptidoglycan/LPS O-acetylase OafA/YrhL